MAGLLTDDEVLSKSAPSTGLLTDDEVLAKSDKSDKPKRRTPAARAAEAETMGDVVARSKSPVAAALETGMAMGSSALATPIAGISGLVQGAKNLFVDGGKPAGDRVREVQDTLTYKPQTAGGKVVTEVASYPFQKLGEFADYAGGGVADATGSPALGAGVNAVLQTAPALLLGTAGRAGKGAAAPAATADTLASQVAATRAQEALARAGVDWQSLPGEFRQKVTELAKDATAFKAIAPEELARIARAESLPANRAAVQDESGRIRQSKTVLPTKGQAARDPVQLRAEENIAQTDAGAPIRERQMDQNEALVKSLDILKGRTGARAGSAEEVGQVIAGDRVGGDKTVPEGALKMGERKSLQNIGKLYDKARETGEMASTVSIAPLLDYIRTHDNPSTISYATNKLRALKLVNEDEFGNLTPTHDITLNQLEGIRQAAATTARLSSDGVLRHYSGELVGQIDKIIPEESGGAEYKAARAARKAHAMQYEEPQAISKLIEDKTRTDRKVALDNVWNEIVLNKTGGVAGLRRVKDNLLNAEDRETLDSGRKAWREIAGQTVQYIKDEATKSVSQDSRGNWNLQPSALKRAYDRIGEEKLEMILGKSTAGELKNIVQNAIDMKTLPPYKGGSTTVPNLLSTLDKVLSHVPVLGNVSRGAIKMGQDLYKKGSAARDAEDALRDPLPAVEPPSPSRLVSLRDLVARASGKVSPAVPLSQTGQGAQGQ